MSEEIKPQNIFSPEFSKKLGELLPRGAGSRIARDLKCSTAAVSQIFSGTYCDYGSDLAKSIIKRGAEIAKQHQKQDGKDANAILKLINQ